MHNFQTGGPCLSFAYFSMQFYNPGDPKGGPWHNAPYKYAHDYLTPIENQRKVSFQEHYDAVAVWESNRESATFRSLARRCSLVSNRIIFFVCYWISVSDLKLGTGFIELAL